MSAVDLFTSSPLSSVCRRPSKLTGEMVLATASHAYQWYIEGTTIAPMIYYPCSARVIINRCPFQSFTVLSFRFVQTPIILTRPWRVLTMFPRSNFDPHHQSIIVELKPTATHGVATWMSNVKRLRRNFQIFFLQVGRLAHRSRFLRLCWRYIGHLILHCTPRAKDVSVTFTFDHTHTAACWQPDAGYCVTDSPKTPSTNDDWLTDFLRLSTECDRSLSSEN